MLASQPKPTNEPSTLRRQHDRITRSPAQIADTLGQIADPWLAESLLGRLERNRDISRSQRLGGEQFASLFRQAALDPLHASDPRNEPAKDFGYAPHSPERARRLVHDALDALGGLASPCGDVAWHILGCELSFRDYSMREGKMRREVSKGALLGALAILARHFGFEKA